MNAYMKAAAIEEIRRRVETATDAHQRVKLLVLEKAIETEMSLEQVGQIIDEVGDVFGYAFRLPEPLLETTCDPTTFIWVEPIGGDVERFTRYAVCLNKGVELNEDEKKARVDFICTWLGVGVGE